MSLTPFKPLEAPCVTIVLGDGAANAPASTNLATRILVTSPAQDEREGYGWKGSAPASGLPYALSRRGLIGCAGETTFISAERGVAAGTGRLLRRGAASARAG